VLASLYSFTGGNDGENQQAGLGRASQLPGAMRWPSGEKATDITPRLCPREREQFLAAGRLPYLGCLIITAGDNPPARW